MPFKLIGSHEYSYYGILDILLSNISYLNIIFSIFFFLTICSLGTYCLKYSFINYINKKFDSYEKNIILYIGSFTFGSVIFVGIYRFLSLNLSIEILNLLFLIYIVFFIFIYLLNIKNIFLIFYKNKQISLSITALFFFILLLQLNMGGHHIIGDAFYNYGFAQVIKPLFYSEHIPIIGSHYFEELFIFPIIFFLQDFLYTSSLEQTTFQVMWSFQAFGKLSSICLIYICFRFFEYSRTKCIFYTIVIFATNLSGHYFLNPGLWGSGSPFLLSIHTYRSSGFILFIFISVCYFLKPSFNNSIKNSFTSIFFLMGLSSLGIQYAFLFVLFFLFILSNELGSISILKKFQNILYNKFEINIVLSIFFILLTYLIIGENINTHELAPYILMVPLILSFINFYSINFSKNSFSTNNFFRLILVLLVFFVILAFFGNIFSYKFLFPSSGSNIDFFKSINSSLISIFSKSNQLLSEGKYIYRALIDLDQQNIYQLKNICTQRQELGGLGITGVTIFHCSEGLKNLIFGLGFVFTILAYNSFIIKNIYSKTNKDNSDKYILFLYSLGLFFFIFSLFFNDMVGGKYLVNTRGRFLEISTGLILVVFILLLSKYISYGNHLKIIFCVLSLKIILPFSVNFYDNGNWYFNQIIENIKYLLIIN